MSGGLVPAELQGFFRRRGVSLEIAALLMILFGVLVIVFRDFVWLLVGLYLIVAGIITLLGHVSGPGRVGEAESPD